MSELYLGVKLARDTHEQEEPYYFVASVGPFEAIVHTYGQLRCFTAPNGMEHIPSFSGDFLVVKDLLWSDYFVTTEPLEVNYDPNHCSTFAPWDKKFSAMCLFMHNQDDEDCVHQFVSMPAVVRSLDPRDAVPAAARALQSYLDDGKTDIEMQPNEESSNAFILSYLTDVVMTLDEQCETYDAGVVLRSLGMPTSLPRWRALPCS